MTNASWISPFALVLILGCSAGSRQHDVPLAQIPTVALCELLQQPSKYAGKSVTTTARIASSKEVTGIWDPACRRLGADLHTAESARSTASIVELDDKLRKRGMSDYPVIATLTGTLLPNQWEEHAFLPQPRLVFLVSSASNIGRSPTIERR
jgi:hypothetical protein